MHRPALVALVIAPLVVGGCTFFNNLFKPRPSSEPQAGQGGGYVGAPSAQAQAPDSREEALKEAHARLSADLEATRAAIREQGVDSTRALRFAELTVKAFDTQAVARGRIAGPEVAAEALGYPRRRRGRAGGDRRSWRVSSAAIHERGLGDDDQAAGDHKAAALAAEPSVRAFEALAGLGGPRRSATAWWSRPADRRPLVMTTRSPTSSASASNGRAATPRACAGGPRRPRSPPQKELRGARPRPPERERREAAEAAKREHYLIAAVFAAGNCDFGDCSHRGWTTRSAAGEIRTSCSFGECLTRGWETRFPDGTSARTDCSFGECMQRGWETRFPDGTSARTDCSFGECATRGWETRLPDGSSSRTTCQFSECFTRGWETSLPGGGTIRCNCQFGECLTRGTDCS
ncbi:MAG: hypothetical protein R3B09_24845 [Nannocystaceae bacterium]